MGAPYCARRDDAEAAASDNPAVPGSNGVDVEGGRRPPAAERDTGGGGEHLERPTAVEYFHIVVEEDPHFSHVSSIAPPAADRPEQWAPLDLTRLADRVGVVIMRWSAQRDEGFHPLFAFNPRRRTFPGAR